MDVHGGCIPTGDAVVNGLVAHHLTHFPGQLLVLGGGDDHFGGIGGAAQGGHVGVDAGGAVVVLGGGLADGGEFHCTVHAVEGEKITSPVFFGLISAKMREISNHLMLLRQTYRTIKYHKHQIGITRASK